MDIADTRPVELKPWGLVLARHITPGGLRIDTCWAAKGGYSSYHTHWKWVNQFVLHSGSLGVFVGSLPSANVADAERVLSEPGESVSVDAGEPHAFECFEDAHFTEVYWSEDGRPCTGSDPATFDIVRHTRNGMRKVERETRIVVSDDPQQQWLDRLTGLSFDAKRNPQRLLVDRQEYERRQG